MPSSSRLAPDTKLKYTFFAVFSIMLLTGASFLILDNFFQQNSPVGLQKHPWQQGILTFHGFGSYIFSIVVGCLIASHVTLAWPAHKYRKSGISILVSVGLLIISGASFLFLDTENIKNTLVIVHVSSAFATIFSIATHIKRSV